MTIEKDIPLSAADAVRELRELFGTDLSLPITFYTTLLVSVGTRSFGDEQTIENQREQIFSEAKAGKQRETLQDQWRVIEALIIKMGAKAVKKYIWSILDALS